MAFETSIRIDADTRGAQRNVRSLDRNLGRLGRTATGAGRVVGRAFDKLKRNVLNLKTAALGLGAAFALKEVIRVGSTFEQLRIQLKTVTGSVEQAAVAFDGIKKLAIDTPFSVENLTKSFIRLKAIGIEPTKEMMTTFGDVAAGLGRDVTDFTRAAVGAAFGETEALKGFGIAAKAEGDKISFTFNKVTTTVDKEVDAVIGALQKIGKENFAGAAQDQVNSFKGAVSNFGDSMAALLDQVSRSGILDAFATAVRLAADEVTRLTESGAGRDFGVIFLDGVKKAIRGTGAFIDAVLPLAKTIKLIVSGAVASFNSLPEGMKQIGLFGLVFFGIKGKIAIIVGLDVLNDISTAWKKFAKFYGDTRAELRGGLGLDDDRSLEKTIAALENLDMSGTNTNLALAGQSAKGYEDTLDGIIKKFEDLKVKSQLDKAFSFEGPAKKAGGGPKPTDKAVVAGSKFSVKTSDALKTEIELLKVRTATLGQSSSAINAALEMTKIDQAIRKDGLVLSEEELVALGKQISERNSLNDILSNQEFKKETITSLREEIDLLNIKNDTLGQSESVIQRQIEAQQIAHEMAKQGITLTTEEQAKIIELIMEKERLNQSIEDNTKANADAKQIIEDSLSPLDKYNVRLSRLNELLAAGAISNGQFQIALDKSKQTLIESNPILSNMQEGMNSFTDSLVDAASSGESFGDSMKKTFKSMVDSILKDLLRLSTKNFLGQSGAGGGGLGSIFGGIMGLFGGGGGGGVSHIGTQSGSFANGGVFTNRIVSKPTLFPMANGAGLMGEAGPEAIMPLSRGKNGKLGVQGGGGGGTTINIDARGSNGDAAVEAAVERGIRRAAPQLVGAAVNRVKDERSRDPGFFGNGALA